MPIKKNFKPFKTKYVEKPFEKGNAKYLIIVESPSKCRKIEGFLGEQYKCIASKGHIRKIDGLKSIDQKKNYEPKFSTIDEKKCHIDSIKNIIKFFDKGNIILATDDDREGEAIAWHICKVFELDIGSTPRIIFREITQKAIQDAVKSKTTINMKIVEAQLARQVLDILVGYKISPVLWKLLFNNKENSLSAGRCQTPALRLVYDNYLKKDSINKKELLEQVYKTVGVFLPHKLALRLNQEFVESDDVLDFLEKSKDFKHILSIGKEKETTKSPPIPFNTSNLLQTASSKLHISPKDTMSLAQQLYQEGLITYMRTDSTKFSAGFIEDTKKYIIDKFKEDYVGDVDRIENKDETNPHEAIRITHLETKTINSENKRLCSLYHLIWRNSVQSCMSIARYKSTIIQISAPMKYNYSRNIEIPTFLGWQRLVSEIEEDDEDTLPEIQMSGAGLLHYLKSVDISVPIQCHSIESEITVKNKHSHYTEANLIKTLEDLGIGRPSTFASIVETIIERGYVKCQDIDGYKISVKDYKLVDNKIQLVEKEKIFGQEKKKLVIQPLGILTVEFLVKHFDTLFSYDYTKKLERELDEIANGRVDPWYNTCEKCTNQIKELMNPLKTLQKQVFPVDDNHVLIYEKFGPVLRMNAEIDKKPEYKSVKRDINIDLDRLKNGGYTLEDLLEIKEKLLGEYKTMPLYLRTGKFGAYVTWGENTESLKDIKKIFDEIEFVDVCNLLDEKDKNNKNKDDKKSTDENILRSINENLSVRKGKYGAYIFYKRSDMLKPTFLNIKKFPEWFTTCKIETLLGWINETYKLNEKI